MKGKKEACVLLPTADVDCVTVAYTVNICYAVNISCGLRNSCLLSKRIGGV